MNGETVTLTLPVWGLIATFGSVITSAGVVVFGVVVSNRDLRSSLSNLRENLTELHSSVVQLDSSVENLSGLDRLLVRETERRDATEHAIFGRIERIEKKVFGA